MHITTTLMTSVLGGEYTNETLDFTPHYPVDLASQAVRRVFVRITDSRQVTHTHHFTDIDKQGVGLCHPCGAEAWSPGWVKRGVYSAETTSGTVDYIGQEISWRCLQVEHDRGSIAIMLVQQALGGQVITTVAAEISGSDQASTRAGIPVPAMAYGVLGGRVE